MRAAMLTGKDGVVVGGSSGLSPDGRRQLNDVLVSTLDHQPNDDKDTCYRTLLKILGNIVANPAVDKFRRLGAWNSAVKEKIINIPGGLDVLLAVGFAQEDCAQGKVFVLAPSSGAEASEAQAILLAHLRAAPLAAPEGAGLSGSFGSAAQDFRVIETVGKREAALAATPEGSGASAPRGGAAQDFPAVETAGKRGAILQLLEQLEQKNQRCAAARAEKERQVQTAQACLFVDDAQVSSAVSKELRRLVEAEDSLIAEARALQTELTDQALELKQNASAPMPGNTAEGHTEMLRVSLALVRTQSVVHREFDNPNSETCWLSSVFQALWHSQVFRHVFENYYLKQPTDSEEPPLLAAFRATWDRYGRSCTPVKPDDLASAFGVRGWGDAPEAIGRLAGSFCDSPNVVAQRIGQGFAASVPVQVKLYQPQPTPKDAWEVVVAQCQERMPLIGVDIAPPPEGFLSPQTCGKMARTWAPTFPELWFYPDLGRKHKLVAIICLIAFPRHYVVFCRQHRDPAKCRLLNDIPSAIPVSQPDALQDIAWDQLPAVCEAYCLQPRFVLYESDEEVSCSLREAARRGDGCTQM